MKQEGKDTGTPATLSERAYGLLRDDIVAGIFVPGGKLKIDDIRRRYDIGASPIREALSRLASDSLVIAEGQRGFRVAEMSWEDLLDVTETRVLVEGEALEKSIQVGDDHWESICVAAHHRFVLIDKRVREGNVGDLVIWEQANKEFHWALLSVCPRPTLLRLCRQLYDQHDRYRRLSKSHSIGVRDVAAEHKAILDAALKRDAEEAKRLVAEHMQLTAKGLRKLIQPKK